MTFDKDIRDRTNSGKFQDLLQSPIGDFEDLDEKYQTAMQACFLNMFQRTSLSLDRVECRVDPPPYAMMGDSQETEIRLSLVSSAVRGPRAPKNGVSDEEIEAYRNDAQDVALTQTPDGRRILKYLDRAALSPRRRDTWKDDRVRELKKALSSDPHVVCFPEFAVPMPFQRHDLHGYMDPTGYGKHFHDFEEECKKALEVQRKDLEARENRSNYPFAVMGSYHCPREEYNTGVIFPTGDFVDERNVFIVRQQIGREQYDDMVAVQMPMLHRKFFPARRAGERARVPDGMEFFTYRAHGEQNGLNIGVLICSDILDLNQFLNMARLGTFRLGRNPLDVILVPSYNTSEKLVTMCRELSMLASTCVAFVNANPTFEEFPDTNVFVCGYDLDELDRFLPEEQKVMIDPPVEDIICSEADDSCDTRILRLRFDRQNFRWLQKQFQDQAYDMFGFNRTRRIHSSG